MLDLSDLSVPKYAVMGVGPSDHPKIMIVGEALGEQEERQGEPFVGQAGQLLTTLLNRAGIARHACFITNVVKVRPPRNNIRPYIAFKKGHLPYMSEEYKMYEEVLKRQIEAIKPNVIVAIGGVSMWALTRKEGITKWRGSVLESTLVPGVKVIATVHPAAALPFRNYIYQHYITFDLSRAREQGETSDLPNLDHEIIVSPTFERCVEYLDQCDRSERVAFDIEIYAKEVSCISLAHSDKSAISIPFIKDGRDYFTIPQEVYLWRRIGTLLENPAINKVAHNSVFDATFLYNKYSIRTVNMHDTMIAHGILFPDFPKGLDFITTSYTLIPYYKDEGKSLFRKGIASSRELWIYNAKDSLVLMIALPQLLRDLERQGNLETYNRQNSLVDPLLDMGRTGIKMNVESMRRNGIRINKRLEEIKAEIDRIIERPLNLRSPKQLMDYFYKEKRQKPYLEKGKPTTNVRALKQLARKGFQEAHLMLEFRKLDKVKSTYLDAQLDEDGRLRCSFNPVGTKYGRLSSSKTIFGTGMDMQNQPKSMKKFMLVDEGHIAFTIDLAQAENRVMAYLVQDLNLMQAFLNGEDVHSQTAAMIFGGSPTKDYQDSRVASHIGKGDESQRQWGKKMNHALGYGMSANQASLLWEIPLAEAKELVDSWHRAYPSIRQYYNRVQSILRSGQPLTNLFNRKYLCLNRLDDKTFKEAYSFIPQSTVADKTNEHGVLFLRRSAFYDDVILLNQEHDSITYEVPISLGPKVIAEVLRSVVRSLELPIYYRGNSFVIPTEVGITKTNLFDLTHFTSDEVTGPVFVQTLEEYILFD